MAIQIDENEFLSRIYDKIEKIDNNLTELRVTSAKQELEISHFKNIENHISGIDLTLAKQHENLKEHMKRSLHNEEAIDILTKELSPLKEQFNKINILLNWVKFILGSGILIEGIKFFSSLK